LHLVYRRTACETRRALTIGLILVGLGVIGTFQTFLPSLRLTPPRGPALRPGTGSPHIPAAGQAGPLVGRAIRADRPVPLGDG